MVPLKEVKSKMLSTPHVLVGGAIGRHVRAPYLALPLALVSHFALDAIPHVDTVTFFGIGGAKSNFTTTVDGVAAAALLLFLARGQKRWRWILACGFLAITMDILAMVLVWFPHASRLSVLAWLYRLHAFVGADMRPSDWPLGMATQILILGLAVFFLRFAPRKMSRQDA